MTKGTKQQYKIFKIDTLENACTVLKSIIVPVIIDLEKFEKYSKEAEGILKIYNPNSTIPANIYDSIHDKILYQQRELLRLMADFQDTSFSYISVRKILVKKKFLKRVLPEKSSKVLNELLDIRNWTFHNAQSMLVADLEIAKQSVHPDMRAYAKVRPILNPVIIRKIRDYDWKMLEEFTIHNKIRSEQFKLILSEMKEDYQEMIGELPTETFVVTCPNLSKKVEYCDNLMTKFNSEKGGRKIASLSMGIQKGKYDGTPDTFEKLINLSDTNDEK